jgi:hypothetical protein
MGDAISAWSPVACSTPAIDPFPPTVSPVLGPGPRRSRQLDLAPFLLDLKTPGDWVGALFDTGVVPSGVARVRTSFNGSFSVDAWHALTSPYEIRLPDVDSPILYVQLEDAAGNRSEVIPIVPSLARETSVDHAIRLEERAEDRLGTGDIAGARKLVNTSMADIRESLEHAHEALEACGWHEHDDDDEVQEDAQMGDDQAGTKSVCRAREIYVVRALRKVLRRKHAAVEKLEDGKVGKAHDALENALRQERALAAWADANGAHL